MKEGFAVEKPFEGFLFIAVFQVVLIEILYLGLLLALKRFLIASEAFDKKETGASEHITDIKDFLQNRGTCAEFFALSSLLFRQEKGK